MAQSKLTVVIGGEAYDGPPKFEILFNGEKIGEGTISAAIDTTTSGRFADTVIKAPYIESFVFDIPDTLFNEGAEVRVRFLNEAYGGDGSNRDRNLYVASVGINGVVVPGPMMATRSPAGLEPSAILGEFLVIPDGTADGVATAPDRGWPAVGEINAAGLSPEPEPVLEPSTVEPKLTAAPDPAPLPEPEPQVEPEPEVAAAALEPIAEEPPEVERAPAAIAEEPAAAVVEPVETAPVPEPPVETVTPEVPAAPVPGPAPVPAPPVADAPAPNPIPEPEPEPEPVEVAAIERPVTPSPSMRCDLNNLYNVLGFNENSNDLTTRVTERLDQIIKDIGDNTCTLLLTGYSSTQGDFDTNALFAVERAQNVLRYLRDSGLEYTKASALGAGETDEFGPAFSDNRRVVITVTP